MQKVIFSNCFHCKICEKVIQEIDNIWSFSQDLMKKRYRASRDIKYSISTAVPALQPLCYEFYPIFVTYLYSPRICGFFGWKIPLFVLLRVEFLNCFSLSHTLLTPPLYLPFYSIQFLPQESSKKKMLFVKFFPNW